MTDDEQEPCGEKATNVPPKEVTVPDATHPRFRKPKIRCTEETHAPFELKTLHNHFMKWKHRSVNSCSYCGRDDVYEYYFIMDRHEMKIYHDCPPQQVNSTTVPVRDQDRSEIEPISENCDTESSGIGTGYNSTASIFSGQGNDDQSSSSLRRLFPSLSDTVSVQNNTSNGS